MCGRFTSSVRKSQLEERFEIALPDGYSERYNVAPSQLVLAVRAGEEGREAGLLRWGLIPHWAKDPSIAYKLINARAETLLEKAAYRGLVAGRRCLVVADGFYEWRTGADGRREPVRFSLADGTPFAFAGLWTSWTDRERDLTIVSCTIVTTTPNELVAPVHDRMPVILPRELESVWLDPEVGAPEAASLLQPLPPELMRAAPASRDVNSVRNDHPGLLEPERLVA